MSTAETTSKRAGARPGNQHRLTHGCDGYLASGRMPPGCQYIARRLNTLRSLVTKAVEAKTGQISLYHAASIQSLIRHEARCQLLNRYLRREGAGMSLSDRMAVLREISAATDSRDKVLKALQLDQTAAESVFAGLYDLPARQPSAPVTTQQNDAQSESEASQ